MLALLLALTTQQLALANEAPRFLRALDGARKAVEIDAAAVPIFQRRISVTLEEVSLGDALAAIERQANIRLVYSRDVVDVSRPVRLSAQDITIAGALTELLLGAKVDVVLERSGNVTLVPKDLPAPSGTVIGRVTDAKTGQGVPGATVSLSGGRFFALTNDSGSYRLTDVSVGSYTLTVRRIGYVQVTRPVTVSAEQEVTVDVALELSVTPLDAVVVTGTITQTEQKMLPNPITVISAGEIAQRGIAQVNELFRGDVPGMFTADYGEASATIGAPVYVRGSTTLFPYQPSLKTYIDGIEMADPEFLNQIDPSMIDHIEIVRGPQASTLYGAQAMNGVMQVFTKKGSLAGPTHLTATLGVGALEGAYGTGIRHHDALSVTGGSVDLSYNAGLTYHHDGAWTRDHSVDMYSAYGSLSLQPVGKPVRVDVTARAGWQESRTGGGMALATEMADGTLQVDPGQFAVHHEALSQPQQTLGVSVHHQVRSWWVQTVTAGLDRGSSSGDQVLHPSFASPPESLTAVVSLQDARLTTAYNSAFDWRLNDRLSANVIVGADYWTYESNSFYTDASATDVGELGVGPGASLTRERDHDLGLFSQAMLAVRSALFLTAGARVDQGPTLPADQHHRSTSPRVGASYVFEMGAVRAKVRGGYGGALMPATPAQKRYVQYAPTIVQLANPNLLPERQTGWDAGVELYAGDRASLSVTRYHQLARDLIAQVYSQNGDILQLQYLNIARVRNAGWEAEGSLRLPWSLETRLTYSVVESVVDSLAPDDQTGYRVGDVLPGVPHHTGALSLAKNTSRFSIEGAVSYIGTQKNYDQTAWYRGAYTRLGTPTYDAPLTTFPATYRFALRGSYDLTAHLSLLARCENLTNVLAVDQGVIIADQLGRITTVSLRIH